MSSLVRPAHHEPYKDLMRIYAARERETLARA